VAFRCNSSYKSGFSGVSWAPANDEKAVVSPSDFKSAMIFDGISAALDADGEDLVKSVKGIFAFKVKRDEGGEATWIVDAKNGKGKVEFNGKAKPDVTFLTSDSVLFDLMSGKLNPQKAFFAGKLKISGNMGMAMKLQKFQKKAEAEFEKAKL